MSNDPQTKKAEPRLQKDLCEMDQLVERISHAAYRIRNARKRIAGEDADPPSLEAVTPSVPFGVAPAIEHHLTTLDSISGTLDAEADMLESLV